MKNILKITIIMCFALSAFLTYSQETPEVQDTLKIQKSSETVDIGFGIVQDRKTSTASSSTVGSEVLQQRAAISLQDALYGRLLGLTALQNSGTGWVGDQWFGASFNVRGIQTMNSQGELGENDVLILVDGFPRSIDRLTLDEIESVTVLKDAAAIALYGYTGINGIISVKTKRGPATRGMKVDVKYHHKFTFLPQMVEYADAYTYAQAMNEARRNDGLGQSYTQFELDAFRSGAYPKVYPDVNWQKEALRDVAAEDVVNVNFANRTEKVGFFTMLNYTNSRGLLQGTEENKESAGYSTQLKYSKANVRTNLDVVLNPGTTFQANILGSLFETNRPSGIDAGGIFNTMSYLPAGIFPVHTQDGLWGGSGTFNNWGFYNPVARIQNTGFYREIGVVLNADFKLTQSLDALLDGLSLTGRFGYDAYNIAFENRNRAYSWARESFVFDDAGKPIVGQNIREEDYQTQDQLSFSRGNVATSRSLNFVLSADYQKQMDNHNLAASLIYHYSNPVIRKTQDELDDGILNTFYRSNFMGYLHYDFAGKYVTDVVLAITGSNRSYPHSWSFSPTVSLGWVISEEGFLKESDFVNLLKLRGSFGILHTDNVPRNGSIWMSIYDPYWGSGGGNYILTNADGAISDYGGRTQITLPTTNFKLETANKYNLGIDARLMNSLDITLDAYYQRRNNILMYESGLYSSMAGIGAGYGNRGTVDSKGYEIGLNYNKQFGDWQINLNGMFTHSVNKIIDMVEEPRAYSWLNHKGYAVDQPRGLEFLGFFDNAQDIADSPNQEFSLLRPGDAKYRLQDKAEGDNSINSNDAVPIGYSTTVPQINYAFNAGLEFKGIGANILFQGAGRFNKWDDQLWGQNGYMPLIQSRNIPVEYYENRWTPGLDNTNAKYPALSSSDRPNNSQQSTLWLRDASFLKLRNVELYYRFPESMLKSISLTGLKLSVTGENLYTWTPYIGQDPERSGFTYPSLRGVSAGLSVIF
ncbi:MAG: SusC/RagA family TonB-linked outer membrane protein [Tannerella sp.]|nr:SusC/RagA family TonB-linked outer membrane protein [Tannerella sp.]